MNENVMHLPFSLETDLERTIAADPAWQQGVIWGKPRYGHLEGAVQFHIADVLANIDRQQPLPDDRTKLRLIALVHDTFKYRVNELKPKMGNNHHAHIARLFAEKYIHDPVILDLIELHDEAYNSWRLGMPTRVDGNMLRSALTTCSVGSAPHCRSIHVFSLLTARPTQKTKLP